jgi:hypothetical protein
MRRLFWATVVGVAGLVFVGLLLAREGRRGFGWLLPLVAATGAIAVAAACWIRRRPLRADDRPALARAFVGRVLLGVAIAEIPATIGFAATLVADEPWPVLVGAGFGFVTLALVAPTDADLDRRQAELAAAGSALSLREAVGAAT